MNPLAVRGVVYVDPVPRVAVAAADLLADPAGVRALAEAFAAGLRRGPLWLVFGAAPALAASAPLARAETMRHLADDAAWAAADTADARSPQEATALVLERRLAVEGLRPPRAAPSDALRVPRLACALVPTADPTRDAPELAAAMGAGSVGAAASGASARLHVWSRATPWAALREAAARRGVDLLREAPDALAAGLLR